MTEIKKGEMVDLAKRLRESLTLLIRDGKTVRQERREPKVGDTVRIVGMRFSQGTADLGDIGEVVKVVSGPDPDGDLHLLTDDGRHRLRCPSEVEVIEDGVR